MIKVVVDSACDISGIRVVYDREGEPVRFAKAPLTICVGEREFVDDETLDVAEMMTAMKEYDGATSSACPSPGAWRDCFQDADEVYVLTITSALSGSYNSALVAREMELEEYPEKKIQVFDTLSAGPEMELILEQILREITEGGSFEEICARITEYQKRTKLAFVLHSVDNLVKNGRVSKLAGFAASLLGIAVVGRASKKGELEMVAKARSTGKTNGLVLLEMKLQGYNGGDVTITHCFNAKAAEQLRDQILKEFPSARVKLMPTGGLCSYYAEQGGMLIGYEAGQREFSVEKVLSAMKPEKVPDRVM